MNTGILIIAHAPLASALRQCVLHVFPEDPLAVVAFDVNSDAPLQETQEAAARAMARLPDTHVLVLTDVFGATPCSVAEKLIDGTRSRLIAGVNLPMLLRIVNYRRDKVSRRESLDDMVAFAMVGGKQGVMQVATAAPQNQARRTNDQDHDDHQQ